MTGANQAKEVLDYYDLDQNELLVRGRSLLVLIERHTFAELVILAMTGHVVPTSTLSALIKQADRAAQHYYRRLTNTSPIAQSATGVISDIARRILSLDASKGAFVAPSPDPGIMTEEEWHGFVLFHAVERLVADYFFPVSAEERNQATGETVDVATYAAGLMRCFVRPRVDPESSAAPAPDKFMGALIGGFGIVAPTTVLARFAASTRASIEWGVVASAMGCGPAHLGACSLAMRRLEETGLRDESEDAVCAEYCKRSPFPGFGHPIMPRDPRAPYLFGSFDAFPLVRKAREVAELITQRSGLYPNVDFAAATLCLSYGIPVVAGSLFLWFCRLPIIIAHICAKRREPPFGLRAAEARERYRNLPAHWI